MAEHNIVSLTARTPLVTDPERTVAAKVESVSLTTTVSKPELTTVVKDIQLDSIITGMGEENIPDPKLFKFVADSYNLSEQALKTVYKNLVESTTTQELNTKTVLKTLLDATTTQETVVKVWTAIRSYQDSFINSEQVSLDTEKAALDTATSQDVAAKLVSTVYTDATSLSDLAYATILVSSGKFDTASTTDLVGLVAEFNRSFEDVVFSTDDFYGAANIDDDQIAFVEKVLADWTALQEETRLAFIKAPFVDVNTITDVVSTTPGLVKTEQVNYSDSLVSLDTEKLNLEALATQDTSFIDIATGTTLDNVASTEESAKLVETPQVDSIANTDSLVLDTNAGYLDTADSLEEIALAATTTKTDVISKVDSISLGFDKAAYTDYYGLDETLFTKTIGVFLEELDYYSQDYFAETDYVVYAVHISEDLVDKQINKNIINYVDATDDFLGTATLGDDEYAVVAKVLLDTADASETLATQTSFIRDYQDSATVVETVVTVSDTYRNYLDSYLVTDLVTTQAAFIRSTEETAVVAELVTTQATFLRELTETANTQDSLTTLATFSRAPTDTSNLSETVTLANAKTLLDNTSSLEAVFMIEAKVLEDYVSTPQIISLDKQSYYSQDYVELGYVGENYTY